MVSTLSTCKPLWPQWAHSYHDWVDCISHSLGIYWQEMAHTIFPTTRTEHPSCQSGLNCLHTPTLGHETLLNSKRHIQAYLVVISCWTDMESALTCLPNLWWSLRDRLDSNTFPVQGRQNIACYALQSICIASGELFHLHWELQNFILQHTLSELGTAPFIGSSFWGDAQNQDLCAHTVQS